MRQGLAICIALLCGMVAMAPAQPASTTAKSASCSFDDGKQITVRYQDEQNGKKEKLREGKIWMPGGEPMLLFTQAELSFGNADIPVGAYSMYVIPQRGNWAVVINKNVNAGAQYNPSEDLARVQTEMGTLEEPSPGFSIVFGHIAPKECSMRMYYEKTGAWVEFKEK